MSNKFSVIGARSRTMKAAKYMDDQLTEHQLMKLLFDLEQRIVACEQLLGLVDERPRLKLVKGHRRG